MLYKETKQGNWQCAMRTNSETMTTQPKLQAVGRNRIHEQWGRILKDIVDMVYNEGIISLNTHKHCCTSIEQNVYEMIMIYICITSTH